MMVRSRRLELPRHFCHSDLNAARLPIPPRPQIQAEQGATGSKPLEALQVFFLQADARVNDKSAAQNQPKAKDDDGEKAQRNPIQVFFDKGADRCAIAAN